MEVENLPAVVKPPKVIHPKLIVSPHPISASLGRSLFYDKFLPGESLGEYFRRLNLLHAIPDNFVLSINDSRISFDNIDDIYPRDGDMIIMRARVHGGGDNQDSNKALRTVLMIAVLVLSRSPQLAAAVGGYGGAIVLIGGMLLISMLVPIRIPKFDESQPSPTYSLTGGANRARPYEPLPLVFGTVRMYPDHGARPFTEIIDRDQLLIQVFNFGLSDVSYTDEKIGETLLSSFIDTKIEDSSDYGDGFTGLLYDYPTNVDSLAGGDLVANAGTFIERRSSINTTRLVIDISGISYFVGREEGLTFARVTLVAEYSVADANEWQPFFSVDSNWFKFYTNNIDIVNGDKETLRISKFRDVPEGQYDVRVKLEDLADVVYNTIVCNYDEEGHQTDCWSETTYSARGLNNGGMVQILAFDQLKSHQSDTSDYTNQKRLALSIKANAQLSGRIDVFNVIASAKVLVWTDSTWTNQVSSNPAWQFLSLVKGKFDGTRRLYGAGLPDSRIDIDTIKLWGAWCDDKTLECNIVFDGKMTVIDMINTIARCGRATTTWSNGTIGVVYDEADKVATAMFGMSNIILDSFQINYVTINQVDEVIVAFNNPDIAWQRDTVRATVPGVTSPVNAVTIEIPGITNELQAGKEANLIAAEQFYRRRIITWETDMEGLAVTRGEVAILSHDITQWDYSGRLISGTTTELVLDRQVPFVPNTQHYVGVKYPDGTYEIVDTAFAGGVDNLINYPEDFDNAYWIKREMVVIPNNTNAPDGTMTADKIAPTSSALSADIYFTEETVGIGLSTFSKYLKAGEYKKVRIVFWNATDLSRGSTDFDLELGIVHSGPGAIEKIGDGWYRCSTEATNTTGADKAHTYVLDDTWSQAFVGNSFDGVYVWGAMFNPGTLANYINDTDTLSLLTALPLSPDADVDNDPIDYMWFFGPKATPGKLIKITDITPLSQDRVRIVATDEEDDYYLSELNTYIYVTPDSFITGIPIISGLALGESLIIVGSGFASEVNVSWVVTGEYGGAFIRAGDEDTPIRDIGQTLDASFVFEWAIGKTVTVEVITYNLSFESSDVSRSSKSLLLIGKKLLPSDVSLFTVTQVETGFLLEWSPVIDVDLLEYEIRIGAWVDKVVLNNVRTTSYLHPNPPVGLNTYSMKAIDTSLNYSQNEKIVEHTVYPPADITDFAASILSGNVLLTWSLLSTSYPIKDYEIREGTVWSEAILLTKTLATSLSVDISSAGTKNYLIKAFDILNK